MHILNEWNLPESAELSSTFMDILGQGLGWRSWALTKKQGAALALREMDGASQLGKHF